LHEELAAIGARRARSLIAVLTALLEKLARTLRAGFRVASFRDAGLAQHGRAVLAAHVARVGRRGRFRAAVDTRLPGRFGLRSALFLAAACVGAFRGDFVGQLGATVIAVRRERDLAVHAAFPQEVPRFLLTGGWIGARRHQARLEHFLGSGCAAVGAVRRRWLIAAVEAFLQHRLGPGAAFLRHATACDTFVVRFGGESSAALIARRRRGRFGAAALLEAGAEHSVGAGLALRGIDALRIAFFVRLHGRVLAPVLAGRRGDGLAARKAALEQLGASSLAVAVTIGLAGLRGRVRVLGIARLDELANFVDADVLARRRRLRRHGWFFTLRDALRQRRFENRLALLPRTARLRAAVASFSRGGEASVFAADRNRLAASAARGEGILRELGAALLGAAFLSAASFDLLGECSALRRAVARVGLGLRLGRRETSLEERIAHLRAGIVLAAAGLALGVDFLRERLAALRVDVDFVGARRCGGPGAK
jgi:hypothetical protein